MESELPPWVDREASQSLPALIERGESNELEFKRWIPDDAQSLAKELAALATSGGGKLLIGVEDNGEVVGVGVSSAQEKDQLRDRIQGVASKVQPVVSVEYKVAIVESKAVFVIEVTNQDHAVFYVDYRPYIRDESRSRPARPEEVRDCIWDHGSSDFQRERERVKLDAERQIVEAQDALNRQLIEARNRML